MVGTPKCKSACDQSANLPRCITVKLNAERKAGLMYRGADKSLVRPGRKQVKVSVRMA